MIHVVNFTIEGTIDTEIYLRLYNRIGIFERSIGELEPILGDHFREVTRAVAAKDLTLSEQQQMVDNIGAALEREQASLDKFEEESPCLFAPR